MGMLFRPYMTLRRWVDRSLIHERLRTRLYWIGFGPCLVAGSLLILVLPHAASAFWAALAWMTIWYGFVGWRAWRVYRAHCLWEDRAYDRAETKRLNSPAQWVDDDAVAPPYSQRKYL